MPGDGAQPNGPLLQASDGNFYGTTRAGGTHDCGGPSPIPCGAIFKITPSGAETVVYSFGASPTDGYTPGAPLIQASDGALYGVTSSGGTQGRGTVFRIRLDGTYTTIYSFGASANDGATPVGGLIQASDGNFYGVTASGGANHCNQIPAPGGNCGTVFKVQPDGKETVLYSFGASVADGVTPNGPLLQAADGSLYGTTLNGGANSCSTVGATNNCGTAFRISLAGAVTILHSFGPSFNDAIAPQGPVLQGRDGAFYGTTASGGGGANCGNPFGCGTVYRMTAAGAVTILHAFALTSREDGYGPAPFLIQARDGNFYGTTNSGGTFGADLNGTVFRLTPAGVKTTLYSFGPSDKPSNPLAGVIQASDNSFWGVTNYNGNLGAVGNRSGAGTVFKLTLQ